MVSQKDLVLCRQPEFTGFNNMQPLVSLDEGERNYTISPGTNWDYQEN
jgi:hypothetical protein